MTVLNFTYRDLTIPILLVRRRMRSLRVVVKPGGQVVVSAPTWAWRDAIERFLQDRAQWIYEKYSMRSKQRSFVLTPWIEEGKALLWGKFRPVTMLCSKKEGVKLCEEGVEIMVKEQTPERVNKVYEKFLRALAESSFSEMIDKWMPAFAERGCVRPTLKVKPMRSQWGNYHAGKKLVTMNLHLLKADKQCAEYVIAHELTHMLYLGHGKEFHAFLNEVFPAARACKKRLEAGVTE